MNSTIFSRSIIAILMTASLMSTSCIFDAPGDKFYRTLWESDDTPLGPFEVKEVTLEFLCENYISLKTDGTSMTSYGTYDFNDCTAVFQDLSLELRGHTITFIDAQLSGSTLFLRWRIDDSGYPFTTAMHRLTSHK